MKQRTTGIAGGWVVVAAVLGGCRIDPPSADAYGGSSSGSGGPGASSDGDTGSEVGLGSSSSSSDDGSTITLGVDATGTTGPSSTDETTTTTGDESSSSAGGECGDGHQDPGEACDDGVNDGSYGGCAPDCLGLAEHCGDVIVNGPEVCDDGLNDGGYGGCTPDCLALAEYCGDSIVNGPEVCDDGFNDGSYEGCAPGCGMPGPYCGDLGVNGSEVCDDGINDGAYDGCVPGCLTLAPHCGDGALDGPEMCDDGVNDGNYGGCVPDCLVFAEYCGDGIVNGPEECDGSFDIHNGCFATCEVPTSCTDIKAYDSTAPDGAYVIDPDGGGGSSPFQVYCNMTIDGGGWQLVSVRYQDIGVLFVDAICTGIGADCSGTIPDAQLVPGLAPDLLFATTDNVYWLRLTGLNPPGSDSLLDVITLDRVLEESDDCIPGNGISDDHYCNMNLDAGLMVANSSPTYAPRYITLPAQFVRYGGIWLGNGGGGSDDHVVSLNYGNYCAPTGLQLSDDSDLSFANVTCTQPGALYFRY